MLGGSSQFLETRQVLKSQTYVNGHLETRTYRDILARGAQGPRSQVAGSSRVASGARDRRPTQTFRYSAGALTAPDVEDGFPRQLRPWQASGELAENRLHRPGFRKSMDGLR
jgi:hypothetical protein